MLAVSQLTETVFRNTHAVQAVLRKDFFQFISGCAVKFCICIIIRIIDKRQGYNIESRIKCRVDQVGMHGDLYRVSVHQCLNTFGLISVGKLVCCIYIDFDLSASCFFHKFTELTSAVSPCTCLCCGACKVPCHFRPVKITVIRDSIEGIIVVSCIFRRCASCVRGGLISCISAILCKCFRQSRGNGRNICNYKKDCYRSSDHRHNCLRNLLKSNLQTFFDLDTDCNEQVDTNRRCYLTDCKVNCCHNTKCNNVISQCLAYRKHDRDEDIHS